MPLTISEVATIGLDRAAHARGWRTRWSGASGSRADGVPVVGYTWWPMFALVTWAWRQGRRDVADHLLQMGLWDLDPELNRIGTPLVDANSRRL